MYNCTKTFPKEKNASFIRTRRENEKSIVLLLRPCQRMPYRSFPRCNPTAVEKRQQHQS